MSYCALSCTALGYTGRKISRGVLVVYRARGVLVVHQKGAMLFAVHRGGGTLVVLWFTKRMFHRKLGSSTFDEGFAPAGENEFIEAGNLLTYDDLPCDTPCLIRWLPRFDNIHELCVKIWESRLSHVRHL